MELLYKIVNSCKTPVREVRFNLLTLNNLKRRRRVSPLKIKIPSKICLKNLQIHQLLIQFIIYGSSYMFRHYIAILR
jgi:hypothetical protein